MDIDRITFDKTFAVTDILLMTIGIRPCRESNPSNWFQYCVRHYGFIITWLLLFYTTVAELIFLILIMMEEFSLIDVTSQLPCVGFCSIGLYKMFILSKRRNALAAVMQKLKDIWPHRVDTKEKKDIIETYIILSVFVTTLFSVINVIMVSAFNFLPALEMVYNRRVLNLHYRQLPYNIWFPFDQFKGNLYFFIYVFHVYAGHIVVIGNMGFDCLYCLAIAHICMHYKLLQQNLKTAVQYSEKKTIDGKNLNNLKSFITHHQFLIDFKWFLEDVFSDVIFFNFFGSSIIICLAGFQITTITGYNLVKFSLFLLCFIMELFLLCWYGQELVDNSLAIGYAAYDCEWYMACPKFKKLIILIIHRGQIAQKLTALTFWEVSMQSFSKILSASWSYFTLLKTVYKELPNAKYTNRGL